VIDLRWAQADLDKATMMCADKHPLTISFNYTDGSFSSSRTCIELGTADGTSVTDAVAGCGHRGAAPDSHPRTAVLDVVGNIRKQGAGFRSLTEGLDTTGPMGTAMLTIMSRG
jgi:hypothetical protein